MHVYIHIDINTHTHIHRLGCILRLKIFYIAPYTDHRFQELKMFTFQQKIVRHTKKWVSMVPTKEEKQSMETIPKEAKMLELLSTIPLAITFNRL